MPIPERGSVVAIAQAVAGGACSALDVACATLARATAYEAIQPQVWIERVPDDQVLAQARAIDARVASGTRSIQTCGWIAS